MKKVILITVGTTTLSAGCWEWPGVGALGDFRDDPVGKSKQQWKNFDCIFPLVKQKAIPEGFKFIESCWTDNEPKLPDLPAELATLWVLREALRKKKEPEEIGEGDRILLLCSPNLEGQFCGKVLTPLLVNFFPGADISLETIEKLDPQRSEDLGVALKTIWKSYDRYKDDADKVFFNLTGGYKATSIVLGAMLVARKLEPVTICYLHESANQDALFTIFWNSTEGKLDDRLCLGFFNKGQKLTPTEEGSIGI